ncbi:hypothetical protein HPB47_013057 [Ixodes persulcatus]|uniref:Uncharacterized protein n=1 Tax=Ixodes persulcatus TaxID=34615 RepID=A0AC60NRT6_IXOPE|nr:hypothetical protein HPB47_013057 [Ixodes persulcatus]
MIRKAYKQALGFPPRALEDFSVDCDSESLYSILFLKQQVSLTRFGDTSPSHLSLATCTPSITLKEGRPEPKPYIKAMATNQPSIHGRGLLSRHKRHDSRRRPTKSSCQQLHTTKIQTLTGGRGNATAHLLARELSRRALGDKQERPVPLVTYQEITQHHRLERRIPTHRRINNYRKSRNDITVPYRLTPPTTPLNAISFSPPSIPRYAAYAEPLGPSFIT